MLSSSAVKAKRICKNTEILKLINKYGYGVSYDLVQEIETEYALIRS